MFRIVSSVPLSWKNNLSGRRELGQGRILWARWVTFFSVSLLGTTLDLLTKYLAFSSLGLPGERDPWWLIEGYVGIETAVNPGALFGMGAGFGLVFAALSVVACMAILLWLSKFRAIESKWLLLALALVMGGIFGNLYDRLGLWNPPASVPEWQSGVRDWILFRYEQYVWPNFNIADSLLVCGAIMLAVHSFLMSKQPSDESPSTVTR
jgi:signal peptidase II